MVIQRFFKRKMDFLVALILLTVLAFPFFVIALLIKLESKGPVFFVQERVGKGGKIFKMLKFRSMVDKASTMGAGIEVAKDDPRITKVGKMLRRLRLDEASQLWHVLLGEMSLVGPRPALPHQVAQYTALEKRRLEVKPGMGSMDMMKGGNLLSWKERIELDIWYIDHWSLWLDLKIIVGTFLTVLSGKDEYGKEGIKDYQ